jgi:hypothetical protein
MYNLQNKTNEAHGLLRRSSSQAKGFKPSESPNPSNRSKRSTNGRNARSHRYPNRGIRHGCCRNTYHRKNNDSPSLPSPPLTSHIGEINRGTSRFGPRGENLKHGGFERQCVFSTLYQGESKIYPRFVMPLPRIARGW